jgi:hypothetical protein
MCPVFYGCRDLFSLAIALPGFGWEMMMRPALIYTITLSGNFYSASSLTCDLTGFIDREHDD